MSVHNDDAVATTEAWSELCTSLTDLGQELVTPSYPTGARDTADGYRYLSRLAVLGLQWAVEFGDPEFPAFYRFDDDITKWGGPNVDNRYMRARIRGDLDYRIVGNASTSHGFVLQTSHGDMHLPGEGAPYGELWSPDLDTADDGSFEIVVSAQPHEGNWLPTQPDATVLYIREYFNDWDRETPGWFAIQCIGKEGQCPPPLTPSVMADRLNEARRWIEASLRFWNTYVSDRRQGHTNVVDPPRKVEVGAQGIAYGIGFYDLEDDQAMIIEAEPPSAWHWNILLYNLGWFESLDIANRTTSLNGRQIHVDEDGRYRVVIAHSDPGTPNWLDTSGLHQGMIAYRYVRTATQPVPECRVVPLDEVRGSLPASTPHVSAAMRRDEIARRQRHIARRFRQ